ncbi:MAG: FAD-binding oxidoreductase [Pontixanthobacter sp.]
MTNEPNGDAQFIGAVERLLGRRGFTRNSDDMAPWLTDWRGRYRGSAMGLASPADTAQVAALVGLCAQHRIPIVPQGGNSGMSGGATPDDSGRALLLSLRRMNRIHPVDADARSVVCEAGAILQDLHDAAAGAGLRFPLTLGGKGSATIGGLVSTNAGGTQVLRHGTMRARVLGLEAVMSDGAVLNTLTPLKKDNRGFDLKQLLIGSEGTLGIVTAATLALEEAAGERIVVWTGLRSVQDARALLMQCEAEHGQMLEGFEIIPRHCLDAVCAHLPDAGNPLNGDHAWYALIELVRGRNDDTDLPALAERLLADAFEGGLVEDGTFSANEGQAERFWLLRDSISAAERAIGPAMQHDISVPVARMADFIAAVIPEVETRFAGCTAAAFGHLGDGNVHFHVLAPKGAVAGEWETQEGAQISRFVHDRVTEWGGSISAEHGIGQMKRDELGRLGDPVALSMMRRVKQALDPHDLFNPGKLLPPA